MHCEVIDVPQNDPCQHCTPCMRMKLMELGFIQGQEIDVREQMKGLYIVDMISEHGFVPYSASASLPQRAACSCNALRLIMPRSPLWLL